MSLGIDKASKVRYRRPLNAQQIIVLNWLLKARFSTSKQIATHLGRSDHRSIQNKLKILEDQDFIDKRYDKSYKLIGRSAEYYLTPKGARALLATDTEMEIHENVMKSLYKNKTVSDAFLRHCTSVTDVALKLSTLYGEKLRIFSGPEVRKYDYMPEWISDLIVSYKETTDARPLRAFVDVWDGSKPFFVTVRKTSNYMKFSESGKWIKGAPFPVVLAICENGHLQKKLNRQIRRILYEAEEDNLTFATTTSAQLMEASGPRDAIWARNNDDDEIEKRSFVTLFGTS